MTSFTRADGRAPDQLRPIRITRGFTTNPAGSVLIEYGNTRVMCTASAEQGVPRFKKDSGEGWLTAEYAMLPAATHERMPRESMRGKVKGRTHEISRLVGRSLRAAIDLTLLGENTINIDCDVLQADGGTRTASITGAYVALHLAVGKLLAAGKLAHSPIREAVAAVSLGIVGGVPLLDLDYPEDSGCDSDINLVMTASGNIIEIQGTAEGDAFSPAALTQLLALGQKGIVELLQHQQAAIAAAAG